MGNLTKNRRLIGEQAQKLIMVLFVLLGVGCSTTKNLPEGEILYIGQKETTFTKSSEDEMNGDLLSELEGALNKAPNNSLLGSVRYRRPFPIGLWIYNGTINAKSKFGKWINKTFGAKPILVSSVNPEIRAKIATNILHDFGYFNGSVSSKIIPHKRNRNKAYVKYTVEVGGRPYLVDTLTYIKFDRAIQNTLDYTYPWSKVKRDDQFNVLSLDAERKRVSEILRNLGYYYFNPNLLTYEADTTAVKGCVNLRMKPVNGVSKLAQEKRYLGKTSFYIRGKNGEKTNDSLMYRDLKIYYYNKLEVNPKMLYRWVNADRFTSNSFEKKQADRRLFNQTRHEQMQERLSEVAIFKYIETQYIPRNEDAKNDTLDVEINAALELPMDAQLDFNLTSKSNNQMGPGAAFTLGRRNVFGGGERWDIKLKGSYEWQVGGNRSSHAMNSYELGLSSSLTFPKLFFPTVSNREFTYPTSTVVQLYGNQLNRAKYYTMLSFGGKFSYDIQPKRTMKHTITPLRLTFNILRRTTAEFDSIARINPALYVSLQNQFIPAMEYTFTYDDLAVRRKKNRLWWQTTFTSSGNITSLIYAAAGKKLSQKGKDLLGSPFAQFLKVNSDLRYTWNIDRKNSLVGRVAAGIIWTYGNSLIAPYSEQFYVGGANSIRAFTVRSIGPGGFIPNRDSRYAFIDQTGDIRLEANLEYRFNLIGNLNAALFLDAGNVWLLRDDLVTNSISGNKASQNRENGRFSFKDFLQQIALGTGFGLRYDLDFLVLRLDWGIGLHLPYKTNKSGFYNIENFKDGYGFHFAIGYPF